MKKKISIIIVSIFVLFISGFVVYAFDKETKNKDKLYTNDDKFLIEESYVENTVSKQMNNNNILQLLEKNFSKYGINDNSTSNYKVKYLKNNIDKREETIVETENSIITLNTNTNEFISYVNKKNSFLKNNLSDEETKNIANAIFYDLNICNIDEYKLIFFEKFDEDIWMAGYAKKYGELINTGEQIKFSFAPQTKEIVTLAVNNIEYKDSDVKISKEMATVIANNFLNKSTANAITNVYIDIVRPNELLETNLKKGEVYSQKQYMKKAYVCEFDNIDKTKIYIDCENGEFLGGSVLLGGEF